MPTGIYKHKPQTEKTKRKISKNNARYWLGKNRSLETVEKLRTAHNANKKIGKQHPNWKGMDIQYVSKHQWIYKHYGKANLCENPNCSYPRKTKNRSWIKSPKRFNWANISGEYKRGISDYIQLCASCHALWDKGKPRLKLDVGLIKKLSKYRNLINIKKQK